jgi:hypothetical protein
MKVGLHRNGSRTVSKSVLIIIAGIVPRYMTIDNNLSVALLFMITFSRWEIQGTRLLAMGDWPEFCSLGPGRLSRLFVIENECPKLVA